MNTDNILNNTDYSPPACPAYAGFLGGDVFQNHLQMGFERLGWLNTTSIKFNLQ